MSVLDTPADKTETAASGPESATGPNPFAVVGAALLGGVVLARWIARRGHGHAGR